MSSDILSPDSFLMKYLWHLSAAAGAMGSAVVSWWVARRTMQQEASKERVEAKATQAAGEAHQIDALTRRMQLLMDSYQQRIDDLMGEVQDLRREIVSLRKALDERPRFSEGIGI